MPAELFFFLTILVTTGVAGYAGYQHGCSAERRRLGLAFDKVNRENTKLLMKMDPNLVDGMEDPRNPLNRLIDLVEIKGRVEGLADFMDALYPDEKRVRPRINVSDIIKIREVTE